MSNPKGRQGALKGQLTSLKKLLDGHVAAPLTATSYHHIGEKLAEYTIKLDVINEEIFSGADDDGQAAQQIEYDGILETILQLTNQLRKIPDPAGPPTATPVMVDHGIRLPKFELPTFSGDLMEWTSFSDLFKASIHGNAKLSKGQKLQYMKSSLRGEALLLINSLPITDGNYDEAWKLLTDRYDNKREIVHSHLHRFFNQPCVQTASSAALRRLIDTSNECVRALSVLGRPVDTWDDMLVYLVMERLDKETRQQWILSLTSDDPPTLAEILKYLDQRARALGESRDGSSSSQQSSGSGKTKVISHHGSTQGSCPVCGGTHSLSRCPKFVSSSVPDRKAMIRKHRLCYNCLRAGHGTGECKNGACLKCKGRHHTMIHQEAAADNPSTSGGSTVVNHSSNFAGQTQVLLATALVSVTDVHGNAHTLRALLDDGSQGSFVTETCVQRLRLSTEKVHVTVSGVAGAGVGVAHKKTLLHITSLTDGMFSTNIDCLILPKVTRRLPLERCKSESWTHLRNLKLADPNFHNPGHIDVLFGADVKADVILPRIQRGKKEEPIAQETRLGWVVSGRLKMNGPRDMVVNHASCELDNTMRRFWELEELPDTLHLTADERSCEAHFNATHSRDDNGRYVVRFPFRTPRLALGSSRNRALRRLVLVERRFKSDPKLHEQYKAFMKEYLDLGHMAPIPSCQVDRPLGASYYLPHHPVLKESSTTTKLRVVFDGSAETDSGVSLNQTLLVGPTLQDNLFCILVRFRFHIVALSADVCMMFRQIQIHPDEWDYQRILWREHPSQPVRDFWLKTVTYGTAAAPYQACKSLQQLARDEKDSFPLASAVWEKDAYVDDLLSGADSTAEALVLQDQLIRMMKSGQFLLRKWSSNDPALLEALPPEMRETQLPLSLDTDKAVKTLGLCWHPASDDFTFSVSLPPAQLKITKRLILSEMSKVFDPQGWLAPVTVKAKIMFQLLWRADIEWDDALPEDVVERWMSYRNELPMIQSIAIPRCILSNDNPSLELHGFCDASERAYAGVLYLRCQTSSGVMTNLLVAKTKVSPLKRITLARLELCGALLLARLVSTVVKCLSKHISVIHCWSDSTVVLHWLASPSVRWKTFEANRVSEIQDAVAANHWHHVRGEENPADCASRGISPSELHEHPLWWHGPCWLSLPKVPYPPVPDANMDTVLLAEKKFEIAAFLILNPEESLLSRYSSLSHLQRITAWSQRFIHNLRVKQGDRKVGPLTVNELNAALNVWVMRVQEEEFGPEIKCIRTGQSLPTRSRLACLNPFLDKSGLLRVGGRIQKAKVAEDQKHPVILPKKHHLTTLIIGYEHLRLLHAGTQLLQASLQRRFWILCARDTVRHYVRKCVTCVRHRGEVCQQIMGNLPAARLSVDRPFLCTGVDYAGPFQLRVLKGRGHKNFQAYISLFICMTTRAIHLEPVSDLTSSAFIAALQRFVSRRGKCRDMYSDCGTNFVGANRELKQALAKFRSTEFNQSLSHFATAEGIDWHFNPPSAPHQGGLWEAGVKSVKFHLRRVIGNSVLNWEEFSTLLCQVEACLNSRPISPLTVDPDDLSALTPGHFLIGGPLTAIPEPDLSHIKLGHLARWQLVQQLLQHFWKRWTSEYLARLQQRPKWWSFHPNLQVGNMVLIKDDRFPPLAWPLGRIIQVFPGPDGLVRRVLIKTANGEFERPITKVCHLPIDGCEAGSMDTNK